MVSPVDEQSLILANLSSQQVYSEFPQQRPGSPEKAHILSNEGL